MEKLSEHANIEIDSNIYDKQDLIDLYRLQRQLLIEENIVASLEECVEIWSGYSNNLHASWLFFPRNDEDILKYIKDDSYFVSLYQYCHAPKPI